MRKLSLVLALAAPSLLAGPACAQEIAGGIIFSRHRSFMIPFDSGPGEGRLKQLQLYLSTDLGRTWQPSAVAPPEQKRFRFVSDRDGYFWFAVQTQDLEGRLFPANMAGAEPSLKVVIDTVPPQVTLTPLAPRGAEVGVAWEIRDDNLDLTLPDAVRLEYRTPLTAGAWAPLKLPPSAAQHYWNPGFAGQIEVRLTARDRAGNTQTAATTVGPGGGAAPVFTPATPADPPPPPIAGPLDHERKLVGSKRITLNYELKDVGPSGVSVVELWYTMDGRSWNKYPVKFGEDPTQKNIAFDVVGEGLYGITLVAKSGVGLGERPPQAGDRPQIWIEVDLTKPDVRLQNVMVGQGPEKGKLFITWMARDKNMARDPITLSYAESPSGPWTPIASKLANTGRHIWTMPERVPYQFYLKVEAIDQAGNIGEAVTESLIRVDLAQPKVRILNVEPASP
ncbi:MAG: hypothetical protein U0793_28295 [Gemmataceae bacterium]